MRVSRLAPGDPLSFADLRVPLVSQKGGGSDVSVSSNVCSVERVACGISLRIQREHRPDLLLESTCNLERVMRRSHTPANASDTDRDRLLARMSTVVRLTGLVDQRFTGLWLRRSSRHRFGSVPEQWDGVGRTSKDGVPPGRRLLTDAEGAC